MKVKSLHRWLYRNILHRWGVGYRDDFVCIYCGEVAPATRLFRTLDEMMLAREGGRFNVSLNGTISATGAVSYPQIAGIR